MESRKHFDLVRSTDFDESVSSRTDTNLYRRNLLKLLVVGGGAFLVGKLSSPLADFFVGNKMISMQDFQNFKFVETNRELKILDKTGSEILIVDKDSMYN